MMMGSLLLLFILVVLFACVDVWYLVRGIYSILKGACLSSRRVGSGNNRRSREEILKPILIHGMVLPSDIDLMMHMNNSKYLREMDFGRIQMYRQSGIRDEAIRLRAATLVAAISIRYRRSLQLWERFTLSTKLVHWNDDALYLEQRFIGKAGFTCAIAMVKMVVRSKNGRVSPAEIVARLSEEEVEVESPALSPELKCWIESMEKSSETLKREQLLVNSVKRD